MNHRYESISYNLFFNFFFYKFFVKLSYYNDGTLNRAVNCWGWYDLGELELAFNFFNCFRLKNLVSCVFGTVVEMSRFTLMKWQFMIFFLNLIIFFHLTSTWLRDFYVTKNCVSFWYCSQLTLTLLDSRMGGISGF